MGEFYLGARYQTAFEVAISVSVFLTLTAIIYLRFFYVDFTRIRGLPEIPNGPLIPGHLYMLGTDHASTAEKWSNQHGWPVYQLRLGNRRAVMINSFSAAKEWIIRNQASTVDRPWFHTFHGVVSSTSAATIGTSPWNGRTKKQRRIVGSFTTAPAIQRLQTMLDMEMCQMISGIYNDSKGGTVDIQPHIYQKRLALNIMMMFCYSMRFEKIDDPLLLGILADASTIASFRSTNSNPQDYIPHLRYVGHSSRLTEALSVRSRRDAWLATLLEKVSGTIGTEKSEACVAEGLLEDSENGLTKQDVKTILGGLMSGGFETVFSTAIVGISVLSSPNGQAMQKIAYEEIMKTYSSIDEAFEKGVAEEKSPYIVAFVRETLRFYPPLKLLPPRQTYADFEVGGSKIPKGILVYMNAQAINRDKAIYGPDADVFRPDRWLDRAMSVPPPFHFSFGAGGRMCTAVNLSNRILYATFFRIILSFDLTQSDALPPNTDYIHYKRDPTASNAIQKDYEVKFAPRNKAFLDRVLNKSM